MLSSKSLLLTGIFTLGIQLISASSVTATQQLPPRQLPTPTQKLIAATQQKRIALVIGNSNYLEGGKLRNPINDANDMARELGNLGFEVIKVVDGDKKQMDIALNNFTRKVSQGGVGLFYYAGHGISVNGENYLIPIDARLNNEKDVNYEALPVGMVQNAMESTPANINIIILDACRDNPFSRRWSRSTRTGMFSIGLSPIQTIQGTFIAFATQPGNVAKDGDTKNGTFTSYLLQHIKTPSITIEELFKRVRQSVAKATGSQQIPWDSSSLVADFSFHPTSTDTATTRLSYEDYYKRGLDEYNAKNYSVALSSFNETIKLKPDYAKAYKDRGRVYSKLGNNQAALADYNQAIKLQPGFADAYIDRGNVYYDLGNNQAALADLNQAIKLQPYNIKNITAYTVRGNIYKALGNKQAALANYNQAILRIALPSMYYERGLIYEDLGNKQAALADYTKARDLYQALGMGNTQWYDNVVNQIKKLGI